MLLAGGGERSWGQHTKPRVARVQRWAPLLPKYSTFPTSPFHRRPYPRYRLAVCNKHVLATVPAAPHALPGGEELSVYAPDLYGLSAWLCAVQRATRGPPLALRRLSIDLSLAGTQRHEYGELRSDGPARAVPLAGWQAVHALLRCVNVTGTLRLEVGGRTGGRAGGRVGGWRGRWEGGQPGR